MSFLSRLFGRGGAATALEEGTKAPKDKYASARAQLESDKITLPAVVSQFARHLESSGSYNFTCRNGEDIEADIAIAEGKVCSLEATKQTKIKKLLPIEADAKPVIEKEYIDQVQEVKAQLVELRKELESRHKEEKLAELERQAVDIDHSYRRIDMGFLKRRRWSKKSKCPVPLFAVFNLDKPESWISVRMWRGQDNRHEFEEFVGVPALREYFEDVLKTLVTVVESLLGWWSANSQAQAYLLAKFAGVLPDEVRTKIESWKTQFDEVFLVAEAPSDWEIQTEVVYRPIPQHDPLVIGKKGHYYWLLAAFDTTPAEEYARKEYTLAKPDALSK